MTAGLKAIQSVLCKAVVPAAHLFDEVVSEKINLENTTKTRVEKHLVDTVSLIAHANNTSISTEGAK